MKRGAIEREAAVYALSILHTFNDRMKSVILRGIRADYDVMAIDIDGTVVEGGKGKKGRTSLLNRSDSLKIMFTARDESQRKDTEELLQRIGIDYHGLIMNKLPFTVLFDDRAYNDSELDKRNNIVMPVDDTH